MGSLFGHIYIHFMCTMKKEETQLLYFNLWGQGKKDVYSVYPMLTCCSLLHFIKCIKHELVRHDVGLCIDQNPH